MGLQSTKHCFSLPLFLVLLFLSGTLLSMERGPCEPFLQEWLQVRKKNLFVHVPTSQTADSVNASSEQSTANGIMLWQDSSFNSWC